MVQDTVGQFAHRAGSFAQYSRPEDDAGMLAKQQLQANVNAPWESAVASEGAATAEARTGPDHEEAIAAFAEKREPRFNQ